MRNVIVTTSCACWHWPPCRPPPPPSPQYSKPWPHNILNLPTPMRPYLFWMFDVCVCARIYAWRTVKIRLSRLSNLDHCYE